MAVDASAGFGMSSDGSLVISADAGGLVISAVAGLVISTLAGAASPEAGTGTSSGEMKVSSGPDSVTIFSSLDSSFVKPPWILLKNAESTRRIPMRPPLSPSVSSSSPIALSCPSCSSVVSLSSPSAIKQMLMAFGTEETGLAAVSLSFALAADGTSSVGAAEALE